MYNISLLAQEVKDCICIYEDEVKLNIELDFMEQKRFINKA